MSGSNGQTPAPAPAPQWNRDAEASILGGVLLDNQVLDRLDGLTPWHFYDYKHVAVFNAIRNLQADGRPIDVVTLENEIARTGKLEAIGGVAFLGELVLRVPTPENVSEYARDVRTLWTQRRAMETLRDAIRELGGGVHEPAEAVREVAAQLARFDEQLGAGADADPFTTELRRALADVKAALGRDQHRNRRPLFGADAALLLAEEFPSTQWLVTGLITRGGTAMIGGLPKAAKKTWLATEIAVAIATGTPVCGEFFAERGTVRYFYAEDTRRQVRNRLRALLEGAGRTMPVGRLLLQPRGEFLDLLRDEDLAWIVASCRRGDKPDLLVLDPLRDLHSGEEDKSDSMSEVMRRLRLLGELLGCTVLAVHHHGKPSEATSKRGGGQRMRGSGTIHGSADAGIHFMECDGDGVSVFTNTVESEVKGARAAGRFTLELRIEDDEAGEAVCARWATKREDRDPKPSKKAAVAAAKAKQDAADDDRAFAFVRDLAMRGVRQARRKLRVHDEAPLPDRRMRDALDRLIDVGRLVLEGPIVKIPEPEQHHAA